MEFKLTPCYPRLSPIRPELRDTLLYKVQVLKAKEASLTTFSEYEFSFGWLLTERWFDP